MYYIVSSTSLPFWSKFSLCRNWYYDYYYCTSCSSSFSSSFCFWCCCSCSCTCTCTYIFFLVLRCKLVLIAPRQVPRKDLSPVLRICLRRRSWNGWSQPWDIIRRSRVSFQLVGLKQLIRHFRWLSHDDFARIPYASLASQQPVFEGCVSFTQLDMFLVSSNSSLYCFLATCLNNTSFADEV